MSDDELDDLFDVDDEEENYVPAAVATNGEEVTEPEPEEEPVVETVAPEQVVSTAESEKLMQECCGFRLSIYGTWPTGSKALSKDAKMRIANSEDVDVDQLRVAVGLYDSKEETVAKANELNRRIKAYVSSMTMPLAKAGVGEPSAEGGTYLVRRDQVDDLHKQMLAFEADCEVTSKLMNANREDILESCQAKLKSKYDVKSYPEEWSLKIRWGYPNVSIPEYLEQLAPEVYEHELLQVRQRFEDSYQLATEGMLEQFAAVVSTLADKLTAVIRINPPDDSEHAQYKNAEVFQRITNVEDPEIEKGRVRVIIRHKPKGKKKLEEVDLGVMSNKEYADLRPISSDERKKLYPARVEALFDVIKQFRNIGETMSASPELVEAVEKAAKHLQDCNSSGAAYKELKDSNTFRIRTKEVMDDLSKRLEEQLTVAKKSRRKLIIKKKS